MTYMYVSSVVKRRRKRREEKRREGRKERDFLITWQLSYVPG